MHIAQKAKPTIYKKCLNKVWNDEYHIIENTRTRLEFGKRMLIKNSENI